jgi:hypothetical protein
MTDISLGSSGRATRKGRTAFTSAIALNRFPDPRTDGRRSIDLAALRRRLDGGSRAASGERGVARGFVDFLLGRGPRHT